MEHKPFLMVISAPSGTGKTSVVKGLLIRDPGLFYSVSATTRPKREGEKHGVHYLFMSKKEFKKKIEQGFFVEWSERYGNLYGTPKPPILENLKKGKDIILDLDINGKNSLLKEFGKENVVSVFLLPPDMETLKLRLSRRGAETPEQLRLRLELIRSEIEWANEYDYIVINDELELAIERVMAILKAERMKRHRVIHPLLGKEGA